VGNLAAEDIGVGVISPGALAMVGPLAAEDMGVTMRSAMVSPLAAEGIHVA
jgi:hypothetical protein